MFFINYLSVLAVPFTIFIIVFYGIIEKKKTFDIFLNGAKEGIEIVVNIFPTLIGLFMAIGLLNDSGILLAFANFIEPVLNSINIPKEIISLAIIRPISRKCFNCCRN